MKLCAFQLKPQIHLQKLHPSINSHAQLPNLPKNPSPLKPTPPPRPATTLISIKPSHLEATPKPLKPTGEEEEGPLDGIVPRWAFVGAASMGLALLLLGVDGQEALALGPEGPLVEEFWDNVRRYGLYALTVSTGAIYAILEPIVELLKSPISAILLIIMLVAGFYVGSQVLSAMVGISEFSYDYGY